jgi:hypothetical protein
VLLEVNIFVHWKHPNLAHHITLYVNFLHQCIHLTDFGFGGMGPGWPSWFQASWLGTCSPLQMLTK